MSATILLIDDSPSIRKQIRLALEPALEPEAFLEANDGLQGFKMLVEHRPDVVVCDLVMPGMDGLKFLSMRSAKPELAQIPVIMLTSEDDLERKMEVFDRGAADYVVKPFSDKELVARVRVHYRVKMLQDELRETNARLETLSIKDALTGLYNRRHLDSVLEREIQHMQRYKAPMALIMIDLDHFKQINDRHGHGMGDEVLRNVSKLITASIRVTDFAARYGGEEILLVLPHTSASAASDLAERLRTRIADLTHVLGSDRARCTASFGIAPGVPDQTGVTAATLVQRADQALYQAKHEGRDRVSIWQP
jgi:two-component system, cell cycle response regulator